MRRLKIDYRGSYFVLIFWIILFFPIALVLLFTGSNFDVNDTQYCLNYNGSRFWLAFWTLVFFPVAFILLFLNGLHLKINKIPY